MSKDFMQIQDPTIRYFSAIKLIIYNVENEDRGRSRIWISNEASMQNQKITVSKRKIRKLELWGLFTVIQCKTPVSERKYQVPGDTQVGEVNFCLKCTVPRAWEEEQQWNSAKGGGREGGGGLFHQDPSSLTWNNCPYLSKDSSMFFFLL